MCGHGLQGMLCLLWQTCRSLDRDGVKIDGCSQLSLCGVLWVKSGL